MSLVDEAVAFVGHRVHVLRQREVGTLLAWAGRDLRGQRVLDVAGGDGYWAGQAKRRGASAVCLDLATAKLRRGTKLKDAPGLIEGDALRLPFADETFDIVMSVCAIEHFNDGPLAIDEMVRVLKPGGQLLMSADALTHSSRWPELDAGHRKRYHVVRTYQHDELLKLFAERGLEVSEHKYLFTGERGERLYLNLSRHTLLWNAAAPLAPLVARWDSANDQDSGSVVLVRARKPAAA